MRLRFCALLLSFVGGVLSFPLGATVYPLHDHTQVIGEPRTVVVEEGETLVAIGRRHGLGYLEMQHANPGVDMWIPEPGTEVVLPTRRILPDAPREGIVLNLAELRLYYYPEPDANGRRVVETYAVGIGRMDWLTPLGTTEITMRLEQPAWYPPASLRREAEAEGRQLPRMIPPGPDNPLGEYAVGLDMPGYFIHSTNRPAGVGARVSAGCVRMYPEDIEDLFARLSVGTPVTIINQPYKTAWVEGELLLEAHLPLMEDRQLIDERQDHAYTPALEVIAQALNRYPERRVDYSQVREVLDRQDGIPMPITRSVELQANTAYR